MIPKLPLKFISKREKEKKLYIVSYPQQSGGKAGKGYNKTSTIQVKYFGVIIDEKNASFDGGYLVVKQMRYTVGDLNSEKEAIRKAIAYCIGAKEAEKYFV